MPRLKPRRKIKGFRLIASR